MVRGMVSTELGIGLKLPRVVPEVIVSVTGWLYEGEPALMSVTLTVAWLEMLMESGLIVSDMLVGTGPTGFPMRSVALLLIAPDAPLMSVSVSSPAGVAAVNVTVATPQVAPGQAPLVAVAAGVKAPAPATLDVNVTVAPGMSPEASRTVAFTVVLPPLAMLVGLSDTAMVVGTRGGVPMVIWALPLTVPVPVVTVARMVAVWLSPAGEAAVNVVVAMPEKSVVSEAGAKEPAAALITEKLTLTPDMTRAEASVTVTVTPAVPPFAILAAESETTTAVGVAPLPPEITVEGPLA